MQNIIISVLCVGVICSSATSAPIDYPGGPAGLQRKNEQIKAAMKERQRRIDEEQRQKRKIEEDRQKLIEERRQLELEQWLANENRLKEKYNKEYINNETDGFQYIRNADNYDSLIKHFSASFITDEIKHNHPKKSAKFQENASRNNMAFAAIIFHDMDTLIDYLAELLRSGEKNNIQGSEIYKTINAERERLINIRAEVYLDAFSREEKIFNKITGLKFYCTSETVRNTLAACLSEPGWQPSSGYLYSLQYMQVMQSVGEGVLMVQNPLLTVGGRTAFLYTRKDLVDRQNLDGQYANYIGAYKYQSLTGPRKVYSFRIFDFRNDQVVGGKQFYFYPKILDISNIEDEVIQEAFGGLE
ncbi:hypothetical protein DSCW_32690 [Desulfosarcina widdelii]|uniref:Uncharacterized protein n=1 Tax=Desulfosarcina widdelii TaxID=947919 RepID=A0A5K7Z1L1_9BACT|nr:hypothetical protein [Desulfosarcina widdelii]BBO75852.1 hypothetical protein DSCW_32690 [Desulfosarcina widdelii]